MYLGFEKSNWWTGRRVNDFWMFLFCWQQWMLPNWSQCASKSSYECFFSWTVNFVLFCTANNTTANVKIFNGCDVNSFHGWIYLCVCLYFNMFFFRNMDVLMVSLMLINLIFTVQFVDLKTLERYLIRFSFVNQNYRNECSSLIEWTEKLDFLDSITSGYSVDTTWIKEEE